jgi:hypothetical protein
MSHGNARRSLLTTTGKVVKNSNNQNLPIDTDFIYAKNMALDNPLLPIYGGTGQRRYTKGDLLVARDATTLVKLSVGDDGQVLTCDSEADNGVRWSSSGSGSAYPAGYVSMGDPRFATMTNATTTTYRVDYIYARSCDDTTDLKLDWGATISPSDILMSSNLGTASTTGTTVNSNGIGANIGVGDVITINNEGRRVLSVFPNQNGLTVESAFSSNYVNQAYRRGGPAPNTTYYMYIFGDGEGSCTIGLSTRCFSNVNTGQPITDMPYGDSSKFRQLWPVFITNSSGNGFVAFTYNNNRMISYHDPTNVTSAALYNKNGYSFTHTTNGTATQLYEYQPYGIPKTMELVYLQGSTNAVITSNFAIPDNGLKLYPIESVAIDNTNSGAGTVVFLGGVINYINILGGD